MRIARARVGARIRGPDGAIDAAALDKEQIAAHGFAWMATYVEALRQIRLWAVRLDAEGAFRTTEALILAVAFGDYLAQLAGGIAMAQGEIVRPQDLGLAEDELGPLRTGDSGRLVRGLGEARARLAGLLANGSPAPYGRIGLGDPTLEMIRDQIGRFAERAVAPHAQEWHRRDQLIPIEIIDELAGLGVFGMTLPEEHGGLGLGKMAMCVVSEELSRAYIGVGSLGTRSEIAGELIRLGGTAQQQREWLPGIASGKVIPTAVFTEPNTGSDLASLQTRAVRDGDQYRIFGAKTWITHGARSDLMTLLARTGMPDDSSQRGYRGLSMFLAPKPRGSEADPFPAEGMSGTEIRVLGYRGMKEYEIAFDGFAVPAQGLLGGIEGEGFKQLMATFESARVQTASRAVGVAQERARIGARLCPRTQPVREKADRLPAGLAQAGDDGGRDDAGAPADLFRGARKGRRTALRHRGRHGQAIGRAGRLEQRRQRAADPRRQRLRRRIPDQPGAVRRAHPQHLRRRRRDPGANHRPRPPLRTELTKSASQIAIPAKAGTHLRAARAAHRWIPACAGRLPAAIQAATEIIQQIPLGRALTRPSTSSCRGHPRLPAVPRPGKTWTRGSSPREG